MTTTPDHIAGCTTSAALIEWCFNRSGAVEYDRRHYDSGAFTRRESEMFLYRAWRLAEAVKKGIKAGWIKPDEGARLLRCVYGLPI